MLISWNRNLLWVVPFFIKFLPYSFQFFWTAKPLIHFQKYIVYVFICVSQNKQEYVKLPLSIFFAILYKIYLRKQYRMKFILYLRRVNIKIAKVHLENLEIISTVQKSVDKHVYLASFVWLSLKFGQGKRNKEEETTRIQCISQLWPPGAWLTILITYKHNIFTLIQ